MQAAEAPVSWTVRYKSPQGFDCSLTIRGADLGEVMKRAQSATKQMQGAGCKPCLEEQEIGQAQQQGPEQQAPTCPTHHCAMRMGKRGWYCPTKIADNDGAGKPVYCRQTAR